jgi:hypothetical protein
MNLKDEELHDVDDRTSDEMVQASTTISLCNNSLHSILRPLT